MHILTAATHAASGFPWTTAATIAVAIIGAIATLLTAILGYRSTRTATKVAAQTQAQTATLGSIDVRLQATLDGKDALIDDLLAELRRRNEQEEILRTRLAQLEASFGAYKDQTDSRIRDQGDRISILSSEVNSLRSSDAAWKRWSGQVLIMYATLVERLHRATGETSPGLPPAPPLED